MPSRKPLLWRMFLISSGVLPTGRSRKTRSTSTSLEVDPLTPRGKGLLMFKRLNFQTDLQDARVFYASVYKILLLGITRILFSIFRRLTLYFLLRFHGNLSMETEENLFCNSFCSFAGFPVLVRGLSWFTVPLVKHSSSLLN